MINPDILTGRLGNRLFQIAFLYAQVKGGKIPDWYVQNPKYFDDYREEIKQLFGQNIVPLPYVAIHIRRGKNPINPDEPTYSDNSFYVNLADDTDYYQQAIKFFPNEEFLIFSDDNTYAGNWALKNIFDNKWQLDESDNAIDALNNMAGCKGIIAANSSLSWWAMYLSPGKLPKVYPKKWFTDNIQRVGFLPEWIRI